MEYPVLPAPSWQTDLSEMIVLMGLIWTCLRRLMALTFGMDRPFVTVRLARIAPVEPLLRVQPHPLAPIPAPTPVLTI